MSQADGLEKCQCQRVDSIFVWCSLPCSIPFQQLRRQLRSIKTSIGLNLGAVILTYKYDLVWLHLHREMVAD